MKTYIITTKSPVNANKSFVKILNQINYLKATYNTYAGSYSLEYVKSGSEKYSLGTIAIYRKIALPEFLVDHITIDLDLNQPYFFPIQDILEGILWSIYEFTGVEFDLFDLYTLSTHVINDSNIEGKALVLAEGYKALSKDYSELIDKVGNYKDFDEVIEIIPEKFNDSISPFIYSPLVGMLLENGQLNQYYAERIFTKTFQILDSLEIDESLKNILLQEAITCYPYSISTYLGTNFYFNNIIKRLFLCDFDSDQTQQLVTAILLNIISATTYQSYQIQIDTYAGEIEELDNFIFKPEVLSRVYYCQTGDNNGTLEKYMNYLEDTDVQAKRKKFSANLEGGEDHTIINSYLYNSLSAYHYKRASLVSKLKFYYFSWQHRLKRSPNQINKKLWYYLAGYLLFVSAIFPIINYDYNEIKNTPGLIAIKPYLNGDEIAGLIAILSIMFIAIIFPLSIPIWRSFIKFKNARMDKYSKALLGSVISIISTFIMVILLAIYFVIGMELAWYEDQVKAVGTDTFWTTLSSYKYKDIKEAKFNTADCGEDCTRIEINIQTSSGKTTIQDWDILKKTEPTCKIYQILEEKIKSNGGKVEKTRSYEEMIKRYCSKF